MGAKITAGCGWNPDTQMRMVSAAALLAFLALMAACDTETGIAKSIADQDAEFRVSAGDLFAEYEADDSAASEKYKGKVIVVTGVISKVYRGFLYTPYVELKAGVRCNFSDTEDPVMQGLAEGQTISMKGRGDRMLSTIYGVELRGCTVE